MDSQRQKKVSTLIKKDIAKIIDSVLRNRAFRGVLVSVTNVKTTPDLGQCKVFLSVFPSRKTSDIINFLDNNKFEIKQKFISLVRALTIRFLNKVFYRARGLLVMPDSKQHLRHYILIKSF